MNIGDSATFEVDLEAALSSSYDKVMTPEPSENTTTAEETKTVTEPVKEAAEEQEITDTGSETDKPAEAQPLDPHPRWSADEKAAFAALPREAQEFVLKRESDVEKNLTQKTQEIAEQRKNYDSLEQVLAPRRQELVNQGGEARVINELFQLSDYANRDPAGFIQYFAKNNGIDLGGFAQKQTAEEGDFADPALLAQKQRLDAIEQQINFQKQQADNARVEVVRKEIDNFRNEKDEAGNPKWPHFDAVRGEMQAFFKANTVDNLKDAYDRAVYANPAIRQKIFDEQKKAAEVSRLNATKEAAAKAAKSAGVQVRTKVPASHGAAKGTWEDTVAEAANAVFGA